jgi:predicted nucleic acid-binding protein
MTLVYVDTNIIIDFIEGRNKKAFYFFKDTISCKYELLISSLVLKELEYQKINYLAISKVLNKKLTIVNVTQEHINLAKKFLVFTHQNDAIHAAVAKLENVDKLLTQNIKDFKFLPFATTYDDL